MTNAQAAPQISYDHGVSDRKLIGETIGAFFDRTVETYRDREALVVRHQNIRWSWGELGRRVDDLAAGLMTLGLERGDRVGIWSPNTAEWTLTQFATAKAGLVLVNVNPAYRRAELEYAMNKVECKALILAPALKTSNYLEIVDDLVKAGKLPHLRHIVRLGKDKTPGMLNFDDVATAGGNAERVKLAEVRRGQYEGLKAEIDHRGREPDFGPSRMHPSAGAIAVGARPFLIAYNINLESPDRDLAVRIARRIRESGGGLPRLQANGFLVEEPERADGYPRKAQVSMNLLDFAVTPLWRVWETVRAEAAEDGIELAESELIGLAPLAAFLDVADHVDAPADAPVEDRLAAAARFLKLRDFSPMQALELRLAAAQAAQATPQD